MRHLLGRRLVGGDGVAHRRAHVSRRPDHGFVGADLDAKITVGGMKNENRDRSGTEAVGRVFTQNVPYGRLRIGSILDSFRIPS